MGITFCKPAYTPGPDPEGALWAVSSGPDFQQFQLNLEIYLRLWKSDGHDREWNTASTETGYLDSL